MSEKKKAILYCRSACVSKDGAVLDAQEQMLRKYARSQNYEIVEIIKESCSGKNLNRSGITMLYKAIDKHKVDAVIAKDISRYGRNLEDVFKLIKTLNKKGVKVLTALDDDL